MKTYSYFFLPPRNTVQLVAMCSRKGRMWKCTLSSILLASGRAASDGCSRDVMAQFASFGPFVSMEPIRKINLPSWNENFCWDWILSTCGWRNSALCSTSELWLKFFATMLACTSLTEQHRDFQNCFLPASKWDLPLCGNILSRTKTWITDTLDSTHLEPYVCGWLGLCGRQSWA